MVEETFVGHEKDLDGFHTYYEPLGKPGYLQLKDDAARAAYDKDGCFA
jgi:hypothetical protein